MMNDNNRSRNNTLQAQEALLVSQDADMKAEACPFSKMHPHADSHVSKAGNQCPFAFVPLKFRGRTHVPSSGSKKIFRDGEVSLGDLHMMTDLFYEKAFQDYTLDKFIRSHDDPHGMRFAKWIHQKLTGSTVWDAERRTRSKTPVTLADGIPHVVHDRSSAHVAAWNSPKRDAADVGNHFQLDECRVWMRLHFWALRESGMLEQSPTFADYYVRFIGHFVRVYERTAPAFARDSFRWSANPENIEKYLENGRRMKDVLGLTLKQAESQIPPKEAYDLDWPYIASADGER